MNVGIGTAVAAQFLSWEYLFRIFGLVSLQCNHFDQCSIKMIKFFFIYKEIQSGAVAKSYMRKGFLLYEEMRKYFPIYEEEAVI
jgi:hypothetical protein